MPTAFIHRIAAHSPDDTEGLQNAISDGRIQPRSIVAIIGQVAGRLGINDHACGFAVQSLRMFLMEHMPGAEADKVSLIMSGGYEGFLKPHWLVLEKRDSAENGVFPALAIGIAKTRELQPEHLGRCEQVLLVAEAVREAMAEAGIEKPEDVHSVRIKSPLLSSEMIARAESRAVELRTKYVLDSMSLSRAATALGVAVALDELPEDFSLTDDVIGEDDNLWSGKAHVTSGIELDHHKIVVFGMSNAWSGPLTIEHGVMKNALDLESVRETLEKLGLNTKTLVDGEDHDRLIALFAKTDTRPAGSLLGKQAAMLSVHDPASAQNASTFAAGALAGLTGHTDLFVSAGAEHQGPDGGGPFALIASRKQAPKPQPFYDWWKV